MAITKEQVAEAAEEIQAQGVEPTYINLRERLKSGSFSTIQKYLKEWRSGAAERKPDAAIEIPEPFRDALRRFSLEVWRAAGVWVKDELEGARKDFERRVIEHQAEAEKAAATVDALQVELNKAIGERDRLRGELQTARAALATAEGGLVEARAQLKRETKRNEDLSQRVIGEETKAQALSRRSRSSNACARSLRRHARRPPPPRVPCSRRGCNSSGKPRGMKTCRSA